MMKQSKVFTLILVALALFALAVWIRHELMIDSCLDREGRWNQELSTCEGATER